MKLAGVKVVDLSMFLPGPHFTMMMADHGADVIRIEPPGGEPARQLGLSQGGHSVWFRNTHRGKRSVQLNLKDPRGREFLFKLLADADVLVEGFRPGVMKRLGLDYDTVRAHAPQIVYCSISAFGQTGVYRDKPAHDIAIEALAGTLDFHRGRDGKPTNPGMPAADMAGSLIAFSGVLMALLRQRQTGQGDYVDIALHDSVLAWTSNYAGPAFVEQRGHDVPMERNWGGAAFYNIYATADAKHLVLGGMEHHFCANLLNKAGRPDLLPLTHEVPGPAQQPVREFLESFFAQETLAHWLDWLADIDVCYAPLRTLYEGLYDPATAARGMLVEDEAGMPMLGVPVMYRHEPGKPGGHVPGIGEHGAEIARALGYSEAELAALQADRVL
ncbi:MAG: CaiB/BaiF CoA-transferase family protein [Gammaproteobacteria bacterium]|jgi:crotonobetainyl-CoA:carnitine CoA-transferase CaiB-like acyl-CoA transferase|nr:CaiB/BaiF CoA-transferase family protein [Gammaproteobacteria bacterium]